VNKLNLQRGISSWFKVIRLHHGMNLDHIEDDKILCKITAYQLPHRFYFYKKGL
jgi:hypothetical protein